MKKIATTIIKYLNNLNQNFWNWFRNSKIVDDKGNPLVVYHGTNDKSFNKFDLEFTGKNTDSGMYGKGFYFTNILNYAKTYNRDKNGGVLKVYLRIEKPFIINTKNDIPKIEIPNQTIDDLYNAGIIYSQKFREFLIKHGYDGVIDNTSSTKQFVTLFPNQIKSIKNDGSWSLNDNNIYS